MEVEAGVEVVSLGAEGEAVEVWLEVEAVVGVVLSEAVASVGAAVIRMWGVEAVFCFAVAVAGFHTFGAGVCCTLKVVYEGVAAGFCCTLGVVDVAAEAAYTLVGVSRMQEVVDEVGAAVVCYTLEVAWVEAVACHMLWAAEEGARRMA